MRNRGPYTAPCSSLCPNNQTCNVLQKVQTVMYGSVFENCPDAQFETDEDYAKLNWPKEILSGPENDPMG